NATRPTVTVPGLPVSIPASQTLFSGSADALPNPLVQAGTAPTLAPNYLASLSTANLAPLKADQPAQPTTRPLLYSPARRAPPGNALRRRLRLGRIAQTAVRAGLRWLHPRAVPGAGDDYGRAGQRPPVTSHERRSDSLCARPVLGADARRARPAARRAAGA